MSNWNLPWFPEWNKKNPTDIYTPAILVGLLGGTIIVGVILLAYGHIVGTTSVQTGPAGTGMSQIDFNADLAKVDPTLADYYTEDPIVPEGGEAKAGEVYNNVQVLGDLTQDNFYRLMNAITLWVSPEQGCGYCHAGAADGQYEDDDLYTKVVSRRMIEMTINLNENWDAHVAADGEGGVNCYTCHRGENVPSGIWFKEAPLGETMAGWSANQNRATDLTVSTSLPHDALEKLLLEDGMIKVHNLEPRVSETPGDDGVATWQDTERTFSLMNYFAHSLGQNCTFCHNSRAFNDTAEVTPQWATALMGIDMVREMNQDYLVPLQDSYPAERLGAKHGDAPKAACLTCHKGAQKPMGGMDMVGDWPELTTTDAPEYAAAD